MCACVVAVFVAVVMDYGFVGGVSESSECDGGLWKRQEHTNICVIGIGIAIVLWLSSENEF